MGTTWHVKALAPFPSLLPGQTGIRGGSGSGIKEMIERRLEKISKKMSLYLDESELSRFNAWRPGKVFFASEDMMRVIKEGERLYHLTGGAWDGSVKPLVDLWGFGKTGIKKRPGMAEIARVLPGTGFHHIKIIGERGLLKKGPDVKIDLASIAKGYAVDAIAGDLRLKTIENFIVEVGGEVYASGLKKGGKMWKAGIDTPIRHMPFGHIYKIVSLRDMALATSGDYRNFFRQGETFYSHILDPETGLPPKNNVASASVMAKSCMFADGLATAILVMGAKKGIELADSLEGVECMVVARKNGALVDYYSKGFKGSLCSAQ